MKQRTYILLSLLFISLLSCIDDHSDYGKLIIDDVKIDGIAKVQEIQIGDRLVINPMVTTKFGDKSNLSYVWYKYNDMQSVADTLSFEKNLDVVINDVLPGVEATLVFKITDLSTGVFYINQSQFKTIGKYSGGTLMLCRYDDGNDLAFLKKDGQTLYNNIYATHNNGEKLGAYSKTIYATTNYARNSLPYKAIIVTCDDHTGGVYLDPVLLSKKGTMRSKFIFGDDFKENIVISGYMSDQTNDYLIVNGAVHNRNYDYVENANWNPSIVFLETPNKYETSPYTAHPKGPVFFGTPIFYDNLNSRFMYNAGNGYFNFISASTGETAAFDPINLGENVQLLVTGCRNDSPDHYWSLMQQRNSETNEISYFIITYKFEYNEDMTYNFIAETKKILSNSDAQLLNDITEIVSAVTMKVDNDMPWEVHPRGLSDVFFFIKQNKVYAYNIHTLLNGVVIDGNRENFDITGLSCNIIPDPTPEQPTKTTIQLTVRIKDKSLSGKQGGIATYKLNYIGGLSATKVFQKAGFCDEVISLIEKYD